jgi:hypothetical protein
MKKRWLMGAPFLEANLFSMNPRVNYHFWQVVAWLGALPYNDPQLMSLQLGQHLGSYEINSLLGKGSSGV